MSLFTRTRTNPVFYSDRLALLLSDQPERLARMRTEPHNVDLLTWNVFASLDTHADQNWLAYRLQELGGPSLRAPVRISLFSGRRRAPLLRPSVSYLQHIHRRTGVDHAASDGVVEFEQPIEVPVRIETPDVLLLVDTGRQRLRTGASGRGRIPEVIDCGLEHARRLSSALSVGLVLDADSAVLATVPQMATAEEIARMLPWLDTTPQVGIHGMSWDSLLALWHDEADYLNLGGQPVRAFESYATNAAA